MNTSDLIWPIVIIVGLLAIALIIYFFGYLHGRGEAKKEAEDHQKRSKKFTRSVLGGLFSEQIAPFLPNFPSDLKVSEARFIGKPIDFIFFKGMDEKNISEIVFVEIKTGKSRLTPNEHKLKEAINEGKVRWYEYHQEEGIINLESKIT